MIGVAFWLFLLFLFDFFFVFYFYGPFGQLT